MDGKIIVAGSDDFPPYYDFALARYEPGADVPQTYGEAYDALVKHGKGLFGDRD